MARPGLGLYDRARGSTAVLLRPDICGVCDMTDDKQCFTISAGSDSVTVCLDAARWNRIEDVEQLDEQVTRVIDANPQARLSFDFRQVDYVSSGMLGWLAALNGRVKEQAGPIHLYCLQPAVAELFAQIGYQNELHIHPLGEEP